MKVNIKSLSYSTIGTVALITVLTIWSETSKPFKEILVSMTGHHWITKGVLSLVLFVVLYFVFSGAFKESEDVRKYTYYVIAAVILGGIIIFGFYVWHFFS